MPPASATLLKLSRLSSASVQRSSSRATRYPAIRMAMAAANGGTYNMSCSPPPSSRCQSSFTAIPRLRVCPAVHPASSAGRPRHPPQGHHRIHHRPEFSSPGQRHHLGELGMGAHGGSQQAPLKPEEPPDVEP